MRMHIHMHTQMHMHIHMHMQIRTQLKIRLLVKWAIIVITFYNIPNVAMGTTGVESRCEQLGRTLPTMANG